MPKLFTFAAFFFAISTAEIHASDVALFYALDADLKALQTVTRPLGEPVRLAERTVHRLGLAHHRIYAVKMGSGAVETAISTAALLAHFRCDLAFSIGPAGSIDDTLTPGEWHEVGAVIGYQCGSWDRTGFQLATAEQLKRGKERQERRDQFSIPALFANARVITVASGELFVASSSYRTQLRRTTNAQVVEMNLFGLEKACNDFDVPLFSWRIISDRADDEAGETFRSFVARYDGAGGMALAEIIRRLPADPNSPQSYPELERLITPDVHNSL